MLKSFMSIFVQHLGKIHLSIDILYLSQLVHFDILILHISKEVKNQGLLQFKGNFCAPFFILPKIIYNCQLLGTINWIGVRLSPKTIS